MRALLLVFAVFITSIQLRASEWQIVKVQGRDYVTLQNIADFYQFPSTLVPVGNHVSLDNRRAQIEVMLNSREIFVNGVKQWLGYPVIQTEDHILVSRLDLAKTIEPLLRPTLVPNVTPVRTIVLDAGHGGHDKGAYSRFGYEKDYTLDVARRVRQLLAARGIRVVMTRDSDVFVPLEERAAIANRIPNSVFVSIHFNSSNFNDDASGFEVFAMSPRGAPSTTEDLLEPQHLRAEAGNVADNASLTLATSIQHSLLGNLSQFDRGVKRARFAVLRQTRVPAVLIEGGFLTNDADSRSVASTGWRQQLAQAVATGIDSFRNLAEFRQMPRVLADYRRRLPTSVTLRDATNPAASDADAPKVIIPTSN